MPRNTVALLLLCWLAGCGSAQRVSECTLEERQGLADGLAELVWSDVRARQREPSAATRASAADLVREYGARAVWCALDELLREWSRTAERTLDHERAERIARALRDEATR